VFLVVSKSSMKRAFDLLGGNEKLFWFLEVSRKWDTLDTWLKDLVFPSALQGTVVVMDYYSPEPKRMVKERVPVSMAPDRTVTRYEDVVVEENGEMISGVFKEVFVVGEKAVVFF